MRFHSVVIREVYEEDNMRLKKNEYKSEMREGNRLGRDKKYQ